MSAAPGRSRERELERQLEVKSGIYSVRGSFRHVLRTRLHCYAQLMDMSSLSLWRPKVPFSYEVQQYEPFNAYGSQQVSFFVFFCIACRPSLLATSSSAQSISAASDAPNGLQIHQKLFVFSRRIVEFFCCGARAPSSSFRTSWMPAERARTSYRWAISSHVCHPHMNSSKVMQSLFAQALCLCCVAVIMIRDATRMLAFRGRDSAAFH